MRWYQNGEMHRDDGPAFITRHGEKKWFQHGKLHRENGPAGITEYGTKYWYLNDKLHRIDGPAVIISKYDSIIYNIKGNDWYLNGIEYSKEEWFKQLTQEQLAIALANPENF